MECSRGKSTSLPVLPWVLALVGATSCRGEGTQNRLDVRGGDSGNPTIVFEALISMSDKSFGEGSMTRLELHAERQIDKLVADVAKWAISQDPKDGGGGLELIVSTKTTGKLKRSIVVSRLGDEKSVLSGANLLKMLTEAYSGRFLPVGSNVLFISMPECRDGRVALRVDLSSTEIFRE